MRERVVGILLFAMLLFLPLIAVAHAATVAYAAEEQMPGGEQGYAAGMELTSQAHAVVKAVAVTNETFVVDSTIVNVTWARGYSEVSPGSVTMEFVGVKYVRTCEDNVTCEHYVLHYVSLNVTMFTEDFISKLREKGKGGAWCADLTNLAMTSPTDLKETLKEVIRDRRTLEAQMMNATLFEGEAGAEMAVVRISVYENGTVRVVVLDRTGGLVLEEVMKCLNITTPAETLDTYLYGWNFTGEVPFAAVINLTKALWGKETGAFALTLDCAFEEPLKMRFGAHAIRFVTPGASVEHCVLIAGTMSKENFERYLNGLKDYRLVVIMRSIMEEEEETFDVDEVSPEAIIGNISRIAQRGPRVDKILSAIREKVRVAVGEKCLIDVCDGEISIEKEGKVAIRIAVKGNATIFVHTVAKEEVKVKLETARHRVVSEQILNISDEEIEGTLVIMFKLPAGVENASIAYYDEQRGEWVTVSTEITEIDGELYAVAETTHTSLWALVVPVEEEVPPTPTIEDYIPYITVVLLIILVLGLSAYLVRRRR